MFVALTYIGRDYVPGEVLPPDVPKETLDWLIEAGAVKEVSASSAAPEEAISEDEIPVDIDAAEGIVTEEAPKKARKGRSKK